MIRGLGGISALEEASESRERLFYMRQSHKGKK